MPLPAWLFFASTEFTFAAVFLLASLHAYRAGRTCRLAIAFAYGLVIEYIVYIGVENADGHIPEPHNRRHYDHSASFAVVLPGGVPLYIPLLWATFLYVSHESARGRPAVAAFLAAGLDTTLEPALTSQGAWVYRSSGFTGTFSRWNGAPLVNLLAWFVLQFGYSYSAQLFDYTAVSRSLWCRAALHPHLHHTAQIVIAVVLCLAGFVAMTAARPPYTGLADATLVATAFAVTGCTFLSGLTPPNPTNHTESPKGTGNPSKVGKASSTASKADADVQHDGTNVPVRTWHGLGEPLEGWPGRPEHYLEASSVVVDSPGLLLAVVAVWHLFGLVWAVLRTDGTVNRFTLDEQVVLMVCGAVSAQCFRTQLAEPAGSAASAAPAAGPRNRKEE